MSRKLLPGLVTFVLVSSFILVVLPPKAFAYSCTGGGDHAGVAWDPATDCPGGIAGVHTNVGALTIGTGETATVQQYNGTSFGTVQISAASATITGTLTAAGKGYRGGSSGTPTAEGTGAGWSGTNNAGGGGYGGIGGNPTTHSGSGATYGSVLAPVNMGSGGGYDNNGVAAGNGGGAIQLNVTGTLTVSGTISADGGSAGAACNTGGGAGGSVYLVAGTLAGAGTVTAVGGNGATGCGGAAGGGGRISLNSTNTPTFSGTVTVAAGTTHNGTAAGSGTAQTLQTGTNDLTISAANGTWSSTSDTTYAFHNVTINANVTFTSANATPFVLSSSGTFTLASGVTVSAGGSNTTNSNGVGVYFYLTGNVTIPATSSIIADGLGYAGGTATTAGSGPGGGANGVNTSKGGAYGGNGGNSNASTYGSSTFPTDLGSGGGGDNNGAGGPGGGAINLNTNGTLTVSGTLSANGTNWSGCNSGAGSGGSLYISAATITGSGTIMAAGGNGPTGCGGPAGGGGRVAVYYGTSNTWTGNALTAASATPAGTNHLGTAASNGTVTVMHQALADRTITMSSSTPGASGTSYTMSFTPTSSTAIGGVVVDICDDSPIYNAATCAYPSGFDWGGATPSLTVNGGMGSGWTAAGVQGGAASGHAQVLELSDATPQTVSTSTPISFTITSVTNPSGSNHSFFARVLTFNTSGHMTSEYTVSGTSRTGVLPDSLDHGGFALSTGAGVSITFTIAESLVFCVSGSAISATCSGLTTPALSIGHGSPPTITSTQGDATPAYTQLSTNAQSGAIVRMKAVNACTNGGLSVNPPDAAGGCTNLPGIGNSATVFTTGTADFGLCVAPGSGITVATNYNDSVNNCPTTFNATSKYGMNGANVTSTYGDQIYSAAAPVNAITSTLTFAAEASSTTPAGVYQGNEILIATSTF